MNKQEALNKNISIYWWNMRKKTLDFKGTYEGYFKKRNIKISKVKHPITKENNGIRFKIPAGSSIITFETYGGSYTTWDYVEKFNNAIKLFLTYLGDRAVFESGYGKEYKINWR